MQNTVLGYLEDSARRFPDKAAVIDEHGSVTFCELRRQALSVASAINARLDGRRHTPVFVYLPKGIRCIASFLGILYSGSIYTPSDVKFPLPKVRSIIQCLEPSLLITDALNLERLKECGVDAQSILIYEDISDSETGFETDKAVKSAIDTDPVYVFFTSGSTGKPKGVILSHRAIIDFTDWASERFGIDETHVFGNQAPFYFDQSMPDVYLSIKTGATLRIIPEGLFLFPIRLMEYVRDNGINIINWVPSALCHVANCDALEGMALLGLKKILFCGEVMPNKQLNYWRRHLPDALYVNLYGPTEAAHSCTYFVVDRSFTDEEPLPIGHPDNNADVFLLDEDDRLITGPTTQGEICIRGSALAHGYWNNPQQTRESFCQNPLNPNYPENIYRTGDLAYYNAQGELMYSGRKDFQIKHQGYRIELGEIELAAISADGVDAVCADYDPVNKQIVLFYSGNGMDDKTIQKALAALLPKYMVPARYFKHESLPYNDNGKIDRQALREQYMR